MHGDHEVAVPGCCDEAAVRKPGEDFEVRVRGKDESWRTRRVGRPLEDRVRRGNDETVAPRAPHRLSECRFLDPDGVLTALHVVDTQLVTVEPLDGHRKATTIRTHGELKDRK